jgi:hypothetical protein
MGVENRLLGPVYSKPRRLLSQKEVSGPPFSGRSRQKNAYSACFCAIGVQFSPAGWGKLNILKNMLRTRDNLWYNNCKLVIAKAKKSPNPEKFFLLSSHAKRGLSPILRAPIIYHATKPPGAPYTLLR